MPRARICQGQPKAQSMPPPETGAAVFGFGRMRQAKFMKD
jgi:hypothetical protein